MKSQNGWPASKDPLELGIKSYLVSGTEVKLRCAQSVAPLLIGFAAEFHNLIEPIDGSNDDWAYCYRMVRGSESALSNHSSGTALDLNAAAHPLGAIGTFDANKVPMIRALAKKFGLRWGGDDHLRKAEMHFEILFNAEQVEKLIHKLGSETGEHE